jgi:hypothetical protein
VIGDWMGSLYGANGRRWDYHLFLDHGNRYERAVRCEPDIDRGDTGRWSYDEADRVLQLEPDTPDNSYPMGDRWSVLSVATCEDSNVLLVLRELLFASRNLPILFYRVHCNHRGYGTGWEDRLRP